MPPKAVNLSLNLIIETIQNSSGYYHYCQRQGHSRSSNHNNKAGEVILLIQCYSFGNKVFEIHKRVEIICLFCAKDTHYLIRTRQTFSIYETVNISLRHPFITIN